jgi:hypothetical protein
MSQYAITIPANGSVVTQLTGRFRYTFVRAASQPFQMSLNYGATWTTRRRNDRDENLYPAVERILFRALNGVGSNVEIEASESPIAGQDTEVTGAIQNEISNNVATNLATVPLQFLKVGNVANPVALANAPLYFRWALLLAVKDLAGTVNAGDVKVGFQGGANQQPITLAPGDQYVLPIPVGAKVDFQNVWLKIANVNDGVVALYV